MNINEVNSLLEEIQPALVAAVTHDIEKHVARLAAIGREFYGYALLLGESHDMRGVVVVTNSESDIKVPVSDNLYRYHRFSVDEWTSWERDEFGNTNSVLVEANKLFQSQHSREHDSFLMDECEVAFVGGLLESLVNGLEAAKKAGAFGDTEKFLVVWISDSNVPIMSESAKRLNSATVAAEFTEEFG
ncbi:hypothetical protein RugamoR64_06330 [Duganella rhizosphaerae]|uniref:DUF4303 domain-containing protein n=1 Tax=Duganella rhizosphaerae TaxID=2885763 RepID=UPI0030E7D00D